MSRRQLFQLDGAVARIGRIALKGKATMKDEDGHITNTMSNAEVLRWWKLGTAETELTIRRLRWLQSMSRDPSRHNLVLCAIFGHTRGEQKAGIPAGVVEGKIDIDNGTPWAIQIASDLQKLEKLEAGAQFLEALKGVHLNIFWDEHVKELFLNLDVS